MVRSRGDLGPKLHGTTAVCRTTPPPPPNPDAPPPPHRCILTSGPGYFVAEHVTMGDVARLLAFFPVVERPVLDATGLTGDFDLNMTFTPAYVAPPNLVGKPLANADAASGPSLFTALDEQLGLKLVRDRRSVEIVEITSVKKPSRN